MHFNKQKQRSTKLAKALLCSLLLIAPLSAMATEVDGDGVADATVYRPILGPVIGTWFTASSATGQTYAYQWGFPDDFPLSGKFITANRDDLVVWRPDNGVWYIRVNSDGSLGFPTGLAYQWGFPSDSPQACDINGDGQNELLVFRDSNQTWYYRNSTTSQATTYLTAGAQQWGLSGDVPTPSDFDGDGKCDLTVFRDGQWFVLLSSSNNTTASTVAWGSKDDVPVPGHYTADSILDFAVYREDASPGPLWIIRDSSIAGLTSIVRQWGLAGDIPVPADFDGDGKTDMAVWRPSNGVFYILTSGSGYATALSQQFGLSGDIPMGMKRGSDPE